MKLNSVSSSIKKNYTKRHFTDTEWHFTDTKLFKDDNIQHGLVKKKSDSYISLDLIHFV